MKRMNIEIVKDERLSTPCTNVYSVYLNEEIILECISENEVNTLTISDILKCLTY